MQKQRIPAIEYIRGISMLGVIGIHTGSQYLSNPVTNIHLIALFEILTRFSVPIFFFISAFGLFYNLDLKKDFNYKNFLQRRFKTVLIPYISWSAFYILHYTLLYHDGSLLSLPTILKYLFFGLACYQLYFLVIMLWFYLFMPLWIYMVKRMNRLYLVLLLAFQIAFDYYSSFVLNAYGIENPVLNALFVYRLNYWVLHYIFIFILGGYLAVHYSAFQQFMQKRRLAICLFFWASLASLLAYYYDLVFDKGYNAESAINTAHQLSPAGIIYTIGASIFLFTIFSYNKYPNWVHALLSCLGRHSYFAYLFHPVIITYLAFFLAWQNKLMTAGTTIFFYFTVIILSTLMAMVFRKLGQNAPLLNILTIGVYPKNK